MTEERIAELRDKKAFVQEIGLVLNQHDRCCIEELDYEVYSSGVGHVEYLVVTYKGGAKAVKDCTFDSLSAIFDEIAKLFNGGYYDELPTYIDIKNNNKKVL